MEDNNGNRLLKDFFCEASKAEIADNGFSRRVMRDVDIICQRRMKTASRLWTAVCAVAAIALMPWGNMAEQARGYIMSLLGKTSAMAASAMQFAAHDQVMTLCLIATPLAASLTVAAWCLKNNERI